MQNLINRGSRKSADQYYAAPNASATLVFIHGWCCSPDIFFNQRDYFKSRYSILIPDYLATIDQCVEDSGSWFDACTTHIKNLILQYGLTNIVLVGHSMGGILALSVMQQLTSIISRCIIIETTMPSTKEQQQLFSDFIATLNGSDAEELLATFINRRMINQTFDNLPLVEQQKKIMLQLWKCSPAKLTQLLNEAVLFDSGVAVAACECPLMYIAGMPASGNITALQSLNKQIIIKNILSGHFIMLNQPEELNLVLEDFLNTVVISKE